MIAPFTASGSVARPTADTRFSMHLPEELLDEIFSHVALEDRRTLRNCSLVSKSWLNPSRRLLFSSISIDIASTYRLWLKNIAPTNVELLRCIRSLEYSAQKIGTSYPGIGVYALRDYFPSLSQLKRLAFRNMAIEPTIPDNLGMFSAFQHSISSLTLARGSINWSTFVTVVGHFSHLRHLEVRRVLFRMDDRTIPRISHALRGRFVIWLLESDHLEAFIDRFCKLKLEYDVLVMHGTYQPRLAAAVRATLEYLRVGGCRGES